MVISVKNRLDLMGVHIDVMDTSTALEAVEVLMDSDTPSMIAFANAHVVNLAVTQPEYAAVLRDHALVLNDGIGVSLAARMLSVKFPENLNGTDFTPRVLALAARLGWRVALVGSAPGVTDRAAEVLTRDIPDLQIVATEHGFMNDAQFDVFIERMSTTPVDLLLVGMGCPIQERWVSEVLPRIDASVAMSIGAYFDFVAGEVDRAPEWMRNRGLEWAYRLYLEPQRMFSRYVVGNPVFLARAVRFRYSKSRTR